MGFYAKSQAQAEVAAINTIHQLDSAKYGQIRSLLNLVGIFVILPYPFEKFWYAVSVISSQHLQQQQMPLDSADCRSSHGSPAKFSTAESTGRRRFF